MTGRDNDSGPRRADFLERIDGLDLSEVRAMMARLGSRWMPRSRKALLAFLTDATSPPPDSRGS